MHNTHPTLRPMNEDELYKAMLQPPQVQLYTPYHTHLSCLGAPHRVTRWEERVELVDQLHLHRL